MIPRTVHTAPPVPIHWQEQVLSDLKRDEALGVIERIPYGEQLSWCHRMVVTRKHNGTPRRTVDISPLDKHCKREIFPTESLFHLAKRMPKGTWKTVSDAWNGYHSVPLRQSDRHRTTLITLFGRRRYTRAHQCVLSSGDGYNHRFDAILSDFERKKLCVDAPSTLTPTYRRTGGEPLTFHPCRPSRNRTQRREIQFRAENC